MRKGCTARKVLALVVSIVMMLSIVSVPNTDARAAVSIKSVTVTNLRKSGGTYNKTMKKGRTFTIRAAVNGKKSSKVTYTVTKGKKIVSVTKNGKVTVKKTAKKGQTAVIKVTSKSNKKKYCKVKITVGTPASKVVTSSKTKTVKVGKTAAVYARINKAATSKGVIWKSSNAKIFKVMSTKVSNKKTGQRKCVIKGVSAGKATLWAVAADGSGVKAKITVIIKKKNTVSSSENSTTGTSEENESTDTVTGISVRRDSISLNIGRSYTVNAVVNTTGNAVRTVSYASSDEGIAVVSKAGTITAKGAGKAIITVTADADESKFCTVTVTVSSSYSDETENSVDLHQKSGLLHKELTEWEAPDTCTGIADVADAVDEYVLSASDDELTIAVNDVTGDELQSLNSYIMQKFGVVTSSKSSSGNYTFSVEYNDQFYVYRYIVYGVEIPEDNTRAKAIYNAIVDMLSDVELDTKSDYEKELFFHDYIIDIADYGHTTSETTSSDDAYSVYGLLVDHVCVCEGYALTMELLLSIAGIDNYYISGDATNSDGTAAHAWNLVKLDGNWYHLDATWDDSDDDGTIYTYFNMPDDKISANHTWDTDRWPVCTSMDCNYYNKNGLYFDTYDELVSYLARNSVNIGGKFECAVADYDSSKYVIKDIAKLIWGTYSSITYNISAVSDDYTCIRISKIS